MTVLGISDDDLAKNLGFHWTMICANDVIEGGVPITCPNPEPATMLFFGFGLIFLAKIGRKSSAGGLITGRGRGQQHRTARKFWR